MVDFMIIAVIAVAIFIGVRSGAKHFRGEGDCCGGGSTPAKKKKLGKIVARRTVVIEGMTCEHCKNRVERCINDMEGAAAQVNLKKKEAVISMEKDITDVQIREAIEKAGYQVVEIRG